MRGWMLAFALAVSFGCAGCAADPIAPEGFRLVVRLEGVATSAIDSLRITFLPRMDTGGMPRFAEIAPQIYEGGGITLSVDPSDGALVMVLSGEYVRAHAVDEDMFNRRVTVEIWSDDPEMRMGPQVRATVLRASEQIATGAGFLPSWPPALNNEVVIRVPCSPTFTAQCSGM